MTATAVDADIAGHRTAAGIRTGHADDRFKTVNAMLHGEQIRCPSLVKSKSQSGYMPEAISASVSSCSPAWSKLLLSVQMSWQLRA